MVEAGEFTMLGEPAILMVAAQRCQIDRDRTGD